MAWRHISRWRFSKHSSSPWGRIVSVHGVLRSGWSHVSWRFRPTVQLIQWRELSAICIFQRSGCKCTIKLWGKSFLACRRHTWLDGWMPGGILCWWEGIRRRAIKCRGCSRSFGFRGSYAGHHLATGNGNYILHFALAAKQEANWLIVDFEIVHLHCLSGIFVGTEGNESVAIVTSYNVYTTVRDLEAMEEPANVIRIGCPWQMLEP